MWDDDRWQFVFLISATADSLSACVSCVATFKTAIAFEAEYSLLAVQVGFGIPRPPSLQGKASRSLSSSFGAGLPQMAGMNFTLMMSQIITVFVLFLFDLRFKKLWLPERNCSNMPNFEKSTIFCTLQLLRTTLRKSCRRVNARCECNAGSVRRYITGITRYYSIPRSLLAG